MFRTRTISEAEVYEILANRRRRETIRHLTVAAGDGPIPLRELSEEVAARETGARPPPRDVRESVYNSLHQTHLPKLDELGVVRYDEDARAVRLDDRAREVDRYMEVVTGYGVTWSEIYRTLGVCSLTVVVAALAEAPLVSVVDPLLWATAALVLFALVVATQLWSNRWYVRQALLS